MSRIERYHWVSCSLCGKTHKNNEEHRCDGDDLFGEMTDAESMDMMADQVVMQMNEIRDLRAAGMLCAQRLEKAQARIARLEEENKDLRDELRAWQQGWW